MIFRQGSTQIFQPGYTLFLFFSVSQVEVNERGRSQSRRSRWVSVPLLVSAAQTKCSLKEKSMCLQTNVSLTLTKVLVSKVLLGLCLQYQPSFPQLTIISTAKFSVKQSQIFLKSIKALELFKPIPGKMIFQRWWTEPPDKVLCQKWGLTISQPSRGGWWCLTVDPADVYYTQVQRILYSHPPKYLSRSCALAMNPCQPSVTEVEDCRGTGSQKSDATFDNFSLLTETLSWKGVWTFPTTAYTGWVWIS